MTPRLFAEVSRRNDAYDRARRTNGTVVAAVCVWGSARNKRRRDAREGALRSPRDESEHLVRAEGALPLVRDSVARRGELVRSLRSLWNWNSGTRLPVSVMRRPPPAKLNPPTRTSRGAGRRPGRDVRYSRYSRCSREARGMERDARRFDVSPRYSKRRRGPCRWYARRTRARGGHCVRREVVRGRTRGVSDRRRGDAPHASDTERGDGGRGGGDGQPSSATPRVVERGQERFTTLEGYIAKYE